jgi:hypothetical protein
MHGRVAALLLVGALASTAGAQPVAPPPLRSAESGGFLLPPIAPSEPTSDRPRARGTTDDLPPPPAATFSLPKDITTVSAERVDEVQRGERTPKRKVGTGDLFPERRRPRFDDQPARTSGSFGDHFRDLFDPDKPREWFKGESCFQSMISPVTNPFLFEDPRSTTEVRPIFIYQNIPTDQPNFRGGNMWFAGGQARLAITPRFSMTLNKLGAIGVNSGGGSPYGDHSGLAEVWFGPKYTFIRNEEFGTLLAGGVQFQLPIGSSEVYQDTGELSIVPYASFAKALTGTRFGAFNFMTTGGYAFSTSSERSEYFYLSGHLDLDIFNAHKFYPLVEVNWFQYTTDGTTRFIKGEGRDLVNFGSLGKGSGLVTAAFGGRMKVGRNSEIGAAFEFPLAGPRDFFQNRFTIDFVWRF